MSWRGNRQGSKRGGRLEQEVDGRILQGCSRNTTQSLEVAQGEEKGASKVDKCCQNEIELETPAHFSPQDAQEVR